TSTIVPVTASPRGGSGESRVGLLRAASYPRVGSATPSPRPGPGPQSGGAPGELGRARKYAHMATETMLRPPMSAAADQTGPTLSDPMKSPRGFSNTTTNTSVARPN